MVKISIRYHPEFATKLLKGSVNYIMKNRPEDRHEKIIDEAEKIVASFFDNRIPEDSSKQNSTIFNLRCTVIILSVALLLSILIPIFR